MSDFAGSTSVTKLFVRATQRIDGIAMYVICVSYILIQLFFESEMPRILGFPHVFSTIQVHPGLSMTTPVFFVLYLNFGYFSLSDSRRHQIFNAICLLGIALLGLYKLIS